MERSLTVEGRTEINCDGALSICDDFSADVFEFNKDLTGKTDAEVDHNLVVKGTTYLKDLVVDSLEADSIDISGNLNVGDDANFNGDVNAGTTDLNGDFTVAHKLATGSLNAADLTANDFWVGGDAHFGSAENDCAVTSVGNNGQTGDIETTRNAFVGNDLRAAGAILSDVDVHGSAQTSTLTASSSLNVGGNTKAESASSNLLRTDSIHTGLLDAQTAEVNGSLVVEGNAVISVATSANNIAVEGDVLAATSFTGKDIWIADELDTAGNSAVQNLVVATDSTVESTSSVSGSLFADSAKVTLTASATEATVGHFHAGALTAPNGENHVVGTLDANGATTAQNVVVTGDVSIGKSLTGSNTLNVVEDASVGNDLTVSPGTTTLADVVAKDGYVTLEFTANNFEVALDSTVGGGLNTAGQLHAGNLVSNGLLDVAGAAQARGWFKTGTFTVSGSSAVPTFQVGFDATVDSLTADSIQADSSISAQTFDLGATRATDLRVGANLFANNLQVSGWGMVTGQESSNSFNTGHLVAASLTQSGASFIAGEFKVDGPANFLGDVIMHGPLSVQREVTIAALTMKQDGSFGRDFSSGQTSSFSMEVAHNFVAQATTANDLRVGNDVHIASGLTVGGDASAASLSVLNSITVDYNTVVHDVYVKHTLMVNDPSIISSSAFVEDNVAVTNLFHVLGDLRIGSSLTTAIATLQSVTAAETVVSGLIDVSNVWIGGNAVVAGLEESMSLQTGHFAADSVQIAGDSHITGDLLVENGPVAFNNYLDIAAGFAVVEEAVVAGDLTATYNLVVDGDLDVSGDAAISTVAFSGNLDVTSDVLVNDQLAVAGLGTFDDVSVNTNIDSKKLKAKSAEVGDLDVSGDFTTESLEVIGHTSIDESATIGRELEGGNLDASKSFVVGGDVIADDVTVTQSSKIGGSLWFDTLSSWSVTVAGSGVFAGDYTASGSVDVGQLHVAQNASVLDTTIGGNLFIGSDMAVSGISEFYDSVSILDCKDLLVIADTTTVDQDFNVGGNHQTVGNATVDGSGFITGSVKFLSDVSVQSDAEVGGESSFMANLLVGDDFTLVEQRWCRSRFDPVGTRIPAETPKYDVSFNNAYGSTSLRKIDGISFADDDDCKVFLPNSDVGGDAFFGQDFFVQSNVEICDDLHVELGAWFLGNLDVQEVVDLSELTVEGDTHISGLLSVWNDVEINDKLSVTGYVTILDSIAVTESVLVSGRLCVLENATMNDDVYVDREVYVSGATTVDGSTTVDKRFEGYSNVLVGDGVEVDDDAIFRSTLYVTGNATFHDDLAGDGADVEGDIAVIDCAATKGNLHANMASSTETLTVDGVTAVNDDVSVSNDAFIQPEITIMGNHTTFELDVNGKTTVEGGLESGPFSSQYFGVKGNVYADDQTLTVSDSSTFTTLNTDNLGTLKFTVHNDFSAASLSAADIDVGGNLMVQTGSLLLTGNSWVGGNANLNSLVVNGPAVVDQNVQAGAATLKDTTVQNDFWGTGILSIGGDSSVKGEACVDGDADFGELNVRSDVSIGGELLVNQNATFFDNLAVKGNLGVDGILSVADDFILGGSLTNENAATAYGAVIVDQNLESGSALFQDGLLVQEYFSINSLSVPAADIDGNVEVVGETVVLANVTAGGDVTVGENAVTGNTYINGDLTTADATVDVLNVTGHTSVLGNVNVLNDTDVGGDLEIDGDTFVEGFLNVSGDSYFGDELSVDGFTTLSDDLHVKHSVSVAEELWVEDFVSLKDSLSVAGDIDILGDLLIECELTTTVLDIEGNATVAGNLLVENRTHILGDLSIKEYTTIDYGEFESGKFNGTANISDISVIGEALFRDDLTVCGDTTVDSVTFDGRVQVSCGPLSFRFNGAADEIGATPHEWREPNRNLTECCSDYLVVFAPATSNGNQFYSLLLTGFTLNILMPELEVTRVYRMETLAYDGSSQLIYRYEVGDVIILRGSPDLNKHVELVDYQQVVGSVAAAGGGNIYNGRSIAGVQMADLSRVLDSDELFIYMYSPRVQIASDVNGTPFVQDYPVEWTRIGADMWDIN
eukprot:TRINITY_DN1525_c0_g1_i1.p1 TRINITY_DN1525_c0_g1~~TRINITY_DN1525_c0_g1_i1.p1  ORF type:complete len:2049 (-),score=417.28 TRINITY_DN1525_c0_g1_i1:349-6495(-)